MANILEYLNLHQTHDTINLKALLFVEDVKGVCFLSVLVHLHIHKNNYNRYVTYLIDAKHMKY